MNFQNDASKEEAKTDNSFRIDVHPIYVKISPHSGWNSDVLFD